MHRPLLRARINLDDAEIFVVSGRKQIASSRDLMSIWTHIHVYGSLRWLRHNILFAGLRNHRRIVILASLVLITLHGVAQLSENIFALVGLLLNGILGVAEVDGGYTHVAVLSFVEYRLISLIGA